MSFDENSPDSILSYAKQIEGKSLSMVKSDIASYNISNKGNIGLLVEKLYFNYNPNNDENPDFPRAGLELKVSPLKRLKNGRLKAKERISLSMIDYLEIVNEEFFSSKFYNKNSHLLLMFYLYEKNKPIEERVFKLIGSWELTGTDLKVIEADWNYIKEKIKHGKAHELSEGDTLYLGAATKSSNSSIERNQPYSEIKAKPRAFSLKQGYVNHIIANLSGNENDWGKLIKNTADLEPFEKEPTSRLPLEHFVQSKFTPLLGQSLTNILINYKLDLNKYSKNYYSNIIKRILGIELTKNIEEFEKAEITLKVVRLNSANMPKEHISFPAFKFKKIINEEWETSDLKNQLESKFFFVFFKYDNEELILDSVKFWNMPLKDQEEMKKVWTCTKLLIKNGTIIDKIVNNRWYNKFPNSSDSYVGHVRPHAQNRNDMYYLPVKDVLTGFNKFTKQSFWINKAYIKDVIYNSK